MLEKPNDNTSIARNSFHLQTNKLSSLDKPLDQ